MIMAIILERMGVDSVLMVSRGDSHPMLAVDVAGGGQRFTYKGKACLVAGTTANGGIGMINSTQTGYLKWQGVGLENYASPIASRSARSFFLPVAFLFFMYCSRPM